MLTSAAEPSRLPGTERFIALDSLRGLAALTVVVFHMGAFGFIASLGVFRYAWLMVDFFFVLSGFVIAASYGDRLASGFSRSRFMILRLGRVVPLHAVTVLAFLALEWLFVRPVLHQHDDMFYFWRGFLLMDGVSPATGNFYAPVSWSISVEIALYYVSALLFAAGRRGLAIAFAIVAAALLAMAMDWNYPGFSLLMQRGILGFALGVACYAIHRRSRPALDAGWITVAEVALVAMTIWLLAEFPFGRFTVMACYPLFGAAVLVFALDRGLVSRVLQTRPMVWLGVISYSIYMTHMLVLRTLNRTMPTVLDAIGRPDLIADRSDTFGLNTIELGTAAETVVSIMLIALVLAISSLTWRWLEEPARQWSRSYAKRWNAARTEPEALLA